MVNFFHLLHAHITIILKLVKKYSNDQIIQGIKSNDNDILNYVYKKYYPEVTRYIKRKIRNTEEAKDIFQETMIIIVTQIKENVFSLRSTFGAYIFSISKMLCLRYLEKEGIRKKAFIDNSTLDYIVDKAVDMNQDILDRIEENDRYLLFISHFNKLCKNYQKIIRLRLKKVPLKEIARILGYENEKQVRNIIYYCKSKLVLDIKNDPVYIELCMETSEELNH